MSRLWKTLVQASRPETLDALCALVLKDLERQLSNTLYIRLEAIRATILEKNIDTERFVAMKLALYERMVALAKAVAIPGVMTAQEILDVFHIETALIEGFTLTSELPDPLRDVLLRNGLDHFVHDFHQDTLRTMRRYLQALKAEKAAKP